MANALTITFNVKNAIKNLESVKQKFKEGVDEILNVNTTDIATKAQQLAPKDIGGLHNAISADNSKFLEKHVTVNAFYASFVEFGTGKYAAEYVASLPADWKTFAEQFKNDHGKRTIGGMLFFLQTWFKSHSIDEQHAYLIARSIVLNGTRPHPFLFPAYEQQRPELLKQIEEFLKSLRP